MILRFLAALLISTLPALSADTAWAVPGAPYRAVFKATDAPSSPDAGWEIMLPELGQTNPDLGDLVLTDEAGTQIPFAKIFRSEGDRILLLAQNLSKEQVVYLYYGGNQSRRDLKWEPKTSLLLETRRLPKGAKMEDWAQLEEAWKSATEVDGAGFVPSISHTENPFGADEDFVSHYTGYLKCPDKKATFYTISSDASFILADDRPVFGWPGKHDARSTEMTAPRGEVAINDGRVKIDYYQAKAGSVPVMLLGWIRGDVFQAVPAEAWEHPGKTERSAIENASGFPVPEPKVQVLSHFQEGNSWLFETSASVNVPEGWTAQWEWSDGGKSEGPESKRVLAGPSPASVKVRLVKDKQEVTGLRRVIFSQREKNGDAEEYLSQIAKEDPAQLTPATIAAQMELLFERGNDESIARHAKAWLSKNHEDPLWVTSQIARLRVLPAQAALAELRKIDPSIRKKLPQLRMFELELLVFQLKSAEANQVAQHIASDYPNTDFARLAKIRQGDLQRLLGKLKEAREIYQSAPSAEDPALNSLYSTAIDELLSKDGRVAAEEKLAKWELAQPTAKLDSNFLLVRGNLLMKRGRWNEAIQELESFSAIQTGQPLQVMADFLRAKALSEVGKADEAKKIWTEIATKHPEHQLAPEAAKLAK